MNINRLNRRELLAGMLAGGLLLRESAGARADKTDEAPKYPDAKVIQQLAKDGWVVDYKQADAGREGLGLRGPSILPPEDYVTSFVTLEAQCKVQGKCNVLFPSFAHVCNQTCLATKIEVEANDKLLGRGRDYTVRPVVTRPMGNRFWQVSGITLKKKGPVKIRLTGIVLNAAAPARLDAAKAKILKVGAEANQFEKKYKVSPIAHWLKKPSDALKEAAAAAHGDDTKYRFATLLHILKHLNKKGKLTKGQSHDPEEFVEKDFKGSCGANADFVNFAAHAAGNQYLYYTEGYAAVRKLDYLGLHAWNTACCNGFFIADSLNPELFFPEYPEYIATSVGPNIGHPGGVKTSTSGGWVTGAGEVEDYYIYVSVPNGGIYGEKLAKSKIPEGVKLLADFVAHQRKRVNKR
jgi:hypothetical protein